MKIGETAKLIEATIKPYHKPEYFGLCTKYNDKQGRWETVNSTFVAQKYSQIIKLVQETKAKVKVSGEILHTNYGTGTATIGIDELVTKILLPELSEFIVKD